MFKNLLGPALDKALGHYRTVIPVYDIFPGNDAIEFFSMDFRNTQDPVIDVNAQTMTFFLYGEMSSAGTGCESFHPQPFTALKSSIANQLVFSNTAATCIAEQLGTTPVTKFIMNKRILNEWIPGFGDLTTTTLGAYMPIFSEKLGADLPLKLIFTHRDMVVLFGEQSADVTQDYILQMQVFYDDDPMYQDLNLTSSELFFDEMSFIQTFDMQLENGMIYGDLKKFELDK